MPTAGRLAGAALFAPLFWYLSQISAPYFIAAETAVPDWWAIINAGFGLILGWKMCGGRAGKTGWIGGLGNGLTTGLVIAFVALFAHSFIEMVKLSLRKLYDGPADALIGIFDLLFDYAMLLAQPDVILALLVGSVIAGLVAEYFGKTFR